MIVQISSLSELETLAQQLLARVLPSPEHATLVLLSGDLGSGKTAFTKCIAKLLGITNEVTSPTFVLEKRYVTTASAFSVLIHIDAYRLKGGAELRKLRWEETLNMPNTLILLEWPEFVRDALPPVVAAQLSFTFIDEATRGVDVVSWPELG